MNPEKSVLICGHKYECVLANIGGQTVIESHQEKHLGVLLDSSIYFENHVRNLCKKAGCKLNALSRQCKILPFHKRKWLMNSFFDSQFAYCPLVWMCHSRRMNNKINNLHYRALRIIYRVGHSTFDELLSRENSVTIYHRNIRTLAVEMYKIQLGLSPDFMNDIFPKRELCKIESVVGNTQN